MEMNPILISILGGLVAIVLIYLESKISNKTVTLDKMDYLKYLIIISIIIYGCIYLLTNKKLLQTGGNNTNKEIFTGTPDF